MIEKIDKKYDEIQISIIPKLVQHNELILAREDTVVLYVDFNKYSMDTAQEFYKLLEKVFPQNQILILPKDTRMEVVRNEI